MVVRTSVRLVWRHFIQSRMGDMSSKVRMPSPEEALPGREQSMKVSGTALWICMTFSVHVLTRLWAVKQRQRRKALSRDVIQCYRLRKCSLSLRVQKKSMMGLLQSRKRGALFCFSWICVTRMRSATVTSNRHFVYSRHPDSEYTISKHDLLQFAYSIVNSYVLWTPYSSSINTSYSAPFLFFIFIHFHFRVPFRKQNVFKVSRFFTE